MDSHQRMRQLLNKGEDFCVIEDILDKEYPLERPDQTDECVVAAPERVTAPAA